MVTSRSPRSASRAAIGERMTLRADISNGSTISIRFRSPRDGTWRWLTPEESNFRAGCSDLDGRTSPLRR